MGVMVPHLQHWQKQRTGEGWLAVAPSTPVARYAVVPTVSQVNGRGAMAFRIEDIELGDDTGLLAELVACWRASVEATHTFLAPDDIERIAAYVPDAIASVAHLAVCRDENGQVVGFIGVDGAMIEMLFIHPSLRGCGLGSLLLDHAVSEHGATLVDVNEQNGQAVGFYEHYGFEVFDRSETDGMGDPFPILYMRLRPTSHGSA